jgi:hypothetical protein
MSSGPTKPISEAPHMKTMASKGISNANNAPTDIRKSNLHSQVKCTRFVSNWWAQYCSVFEACDILHNDRIMKEQKIILETDVRSDKLKNYSMIKMRNIQYFEPIWIIRNANLF